MSLPTLRLGWIANRSGLAATTLRHAVHDVRGPLNTLSILVEVLKTAEADGPARADALRRLAQTLQGVGAMLDRVVDASETLAPVLEPLALGAAVQEAVGRWSDPGVTVGCDRAVDLTVSSCATRLPMALDALLHCAARSLPQGGRLGVRIEAHEDSARIAIACEGPAVALPSGKTACKLRPGPTPEADWFALDARIAGLGGELVFDVAPRMVAVTLPRPVGTEEVAPC